MTESEGGVETTRISRRKAIKLGALGAAGGAAAWLLPGTASGARSLGSPPGICARGSGDVCGHKVRQCGVSKTGSPPVPNGWLCVCAADSRSPATHCVEDRILEEGFAKCADKFDCQTGQLCVKRCVEVEQGLFLNFNICAWPCNGSPVVNGED